MNRPLFLAVGLALLCATSVAEAASTSYIATINGTQEVPSVATAATGEATLTFEDTNNALTGSVTFTGVTANGAHIHFGGACGVNGTSLVDLGSTTSPISVNLTLTAQQKDSLIAGTAYVNLHSVANPNGEIRGQIYEVAIAPYPQPTCPPTVPDAGSTSSSSGSSGASDDGGRTGGTTPSDGGGKATSSSGDPVTSSSGGDDGGCSSAGSGSAGSLVFVFGIALALAAATRLRRRR